MVSLDEESLVFWDVSNPRKLKKRALVQFSRGPERETRRGGEHSALGLQLPGSHLSAGHSLPGLRRKFGFCNKGWSVFSSLQYPKVQWRLGNLPDAGVRLEVAPITVNRW